MSILVTGATGFIGRNLVSELCGRGHRVTVLTRKPGQGFPEGVESRIGDIGDRVSLQGIGGEFEALFHLAGFVSFQHNRREDLKTVNGEGTRLILEMAKRLGVRKTVVASSACTLGISESPGEILDERSLPNDSQIQANPYLDSKLLCEKYAREYAETMDVVVALPTTVYGTGDHSLNSGSLVKTVLGGKVLPVPPGGGNVVDVTDVCAGLILALEKGKTGERYVFGGYNLRFLDIFKAILRVGKKKALLAPIPGFLKFPAMGAASLMGALIGSRFLTPQIIGDLFRFKFYSSRKAERELGWKATVSFDRSLSRAIAFYRLKGLLP